MNRLESLGRLAEVEFAAIVVQTDELEAKLRVLLIDGSYVDAWVSRKLVGRFGFHWECRHLGRGMYRYDNFPDTSWCDVATFPFHFHDGDQHLVVAAPFAQTVEQGFREFMTFIQRAMDDAPLNPGHR